MRVFEDDQLKRKKQISTHESTIHSISKIDELTDYFQSLSDLVTYNGHTFFLVSKEKKFYMKTELIDSVVNTLLSIKLLFEHGHFSDTNVLIRKFRDDLLLYLYLIEVADRHSILITQAKRVKHENNAVKWMEDTLDNLHMSDILIYLMENNQVNVVIEKHKLRDSWEKINSNLNSFVHANGREFSRLNYRPLTDINIKNSSKDIVYKLNYISAVFMVLLILIRPSLVSSSDYVDALTEGMSPVEESQYEVAPFIHEFIDNVIVKIHPNLKNFLKDSVYMKID